MCGPMPVSSISSPTDGAGRFRVDRLTEGEHTLTAHASGFSSRTETGAHARVGQVR